MLTNRQKLILKAIIELYIQDGVPVGSKVITKLPYLGFSSATIRYDMAELEKLGYLEKTHTSSGRIPSEKGYRYYLNHLLTRDLDVLDFYPLVDELFQQDLSPERALEAATDLLSQITNYTAVGINAGGSETKLKKLDTVKVSPTDILLIAVAGRGNVEHDMFTSSSSKELDDFGLLISHLNEFFKGMTLKKALKVIDTRLKSQTLRKLSHVESLALSSLKDLFIRLDKENFYLTGMHNLFDDSFFDTFDQVKESFLGLTEENLFDLIADDTSLSIRLGSDIEFLPKANCSIISIPYQIGRSERGNLAVIGPTRMDYRRVIPVMEYIAVNLSELFDDKKEVK